MTMEDPLDHRHPAHRGAKPESSGRHPRGAGPPPHLAPASGRAGKALALDAGEGARRPPAVHARHHRADRAGARRPLRKADAPAPPAEPKSPPAANGDVAPDNLGAYSRRAVTWLEGNYVTLRPSFGEKGAIYAYRTEIAWDTAGSCLAFRERERSDAAYAQFGEVAVPNQSGHIYLVTNRHGQHRLITVSRPTITGEMYGILTTLLSGRGSALTPIAAPIALLPIANVAEPDLRPHQRGRRELRGVSQASAEDDRRAVRSVRGGLTAQSAVTPSRSEGEADPAGARRQARQKERESSRHDARDCFSLRASRALDCFAEQAAPPRPTLSATRLRFATTGGGGEPCAQNLIITFSRASRFPSNRTERPRATHHRCVQNSRGEP